MESLVEGHKTHARQVGLPWLRMRLQRLQLSLAPSCQGPGSAQVVATQEVVQTQYNHLEDDASSLTFSRTKRIMFALESRCLRRTPLHSNVSVLM
eukprot:1520506-Amphidinium_carterae.2